MLVSRDNIVSVIPQRSPMVMIDELLACTDRISICSFEPQESCIFTGNGFFSENGMMENIAQTAAAGVGYRCRQESRNVPVGFIAAIRNLVVHKLPQTGTRLITEVEIINEVMEVTIVKGSVKQAEVLLCECELRIFLQKEHP